MEISSNKSVIVYLVHIVCLHINYLIHNLSLSQEVSFHFKTITTLFKWITNEY